MPSAWSIRRAVAVAVGLVVLGCATTGSGGGGDREVRMVSRSMPELRITSSSSRPIRLTIEVEVDEAGRADVGTLKLLGAGVSDNRDAIARWLEQARFAPAQRGGVAVRGVFKTSIEVRAGTSVRTVRRGCCPE